MTKWFISWNDKDPSYWCETESAGRDPADVLQDFIRRIQARKVAK